MEKNLVKQCVNKCYGLIIIMMELRCDRWTLPLVLHEAKDIAAYQYMSDGQRKTGRMCMI